MDINPNLTADPLSRSVKPFDFKLYLAKIRSNWHWFVLSFIAFIALSYIYVRYATPMYLTTASVLIKEEENNTTGENGLLNAIGGDLAPANSTETEAEIFKTRLLMEKVVKSLNSNISYYRKGKIKKTELDRPPFKVRILGNPPPSAAAQMDIRLDGTKVFLSDGDSGKTVNLYQSFFLKGVGNVQIERGDVKAVPTEIYSFKILPIRTVVESFLGKLEVKIPSKQVNIINLNFANSLPKKSEAVLNELVNAYITVNLTDKNRIADSTIDFIDKRLLLVSDELGKVEGNVASFKKKNKVTDIAAQSAQLITSSTESVQDLSKVETQLNVLNSLVTYLTDETNNERVMPSGVMLDDPNFSALVERYNTIVLEKERSKLSQTEGNPYVQNLNNQIASVRADMLNSLGSLKRTLEISRTTLQNRANQMQGEVTNVPGIERTYLDLERQQQIKQTLYVFLLQKKEETAISKTSNISNCKIIEKPISVGPISPNGKMIIVYGALFGLFLPLGFVYLADMMNMKVRTNEDISSHTHVPVIAEIGGSASAQTIVVSRDARTPVSEQFRNLRTNLSFFLKEGQKKILITSSMSGEGKSFCSINLAAILALSGKKVVIMELDLRKPNLSNKFYLDNSTGYTNYITSPNMRTDQIIRPSGLLDNLFIISSGPIPPNPAELLINERINVLMAELESDFDYIIIDAPPVGLVTDAQLLSKHTALTLFVVRQNFTYKEQLSIPEDIYVHKKMQNIAILINDAKFNTSYGYGYGYFEAEKKSFMRRIFKH